MRIKGPSIDELKSSGGQLRVRVREAGLDILVCIYDDEVYALENRCSHALVRLDRGPLRGSVITCPSHLAQFDVRDGRVLRGPLEGDPSNIRAQDTYDVEVEDDIIYINAPG